MNLTRLIGGKLRFFFSFLLFRSMKIFLERSIPRGDFVLGFRGTKSEFYISIEIKIEKGGKNPTRD